MRIIIDVREHDLIEACRKMAENVAIETAALPIGDVLIRMDDTDETPGKDVVVVERKTLADLLSSIKDGRYEEQSHRLKHASGVSPHHILYMIEGMYSTLKNPEDKKRIMSAMTSLNYFKGFSVLRTCSVYETAETLIQMSQKLEKTIMKGGWVTTPVDVVPEDKPYSGFVKKVKKENIHAENIEEIMLCQIPGISSLYAKSILNHFGGFSGLLDGLKSDTASFANIVYTDGKGKTRKIPKTCEEQIVKLLGCNRIEVPTR